MIIRPRSSIESEDTTLENELSICTDNLINQSWGFVQIIIEAAILACTEWSIPKMTQHSILLQINA